MSDDVAAAKDETTDQQAETKPIKNKDAFEFRLSSSDKASILLSIVTCVFLFIYILPKTAPEGFVGGNLLISTLNFGIYGLFVFACYYNYQQVRRMAIEKSTAAYIEYHSAAMMRHFDEAKVAAPNFTDLSGLIPAERMHTTQIGRLMIRILEDARDYIYDERESILSPYRSEINQDFKRFETLQSTALRLGILGTFIGLIVAITELSGMVDMPAVNDVGATALQHSEGRRSVFVSLSAKLFDAMKYAFGTSIAGLSISLLIALLCVYIKSSAREAIRKTEIAASTMVSLARRATYEDKGILSSFAQLKSSMDLLKQDVQHQVGTATSEMVVLADTLAKQTAYIQDGVEVLSEMKTQWQSYVTIMRDSQTAMVELQKQQNSAFAESTALFKDKISNQQHVLLTKLSETMTILSPEKLGQDIRKSFEQVNTSIESYMSKVVEGLVKNQQQNQETLTATFQNIDDNTVKSIERLSSNVENVITNTSQKQADAVTDNLKENSRQITDSHKSFAENIKSELSTLANSVNGYSNDKNELVVAIKESTKHNVALVEQLKDGNKLDALYELQNSLSKQIPDLIKCEHQLNESVIELQRNPLDAKITAQIDAMGAKLIVPLTSQLSTVNQRYGDLENMLKTLNKSSNGLNDQIAEFNKTNGGFLRRSGTLGFKLTVATNSFIGLVASCSVIVFAGYYIYHNYFAG